MVENMKGREEKGNSQVHKRRRTWRELSGREVPPARGWFALPVEPCAPGNA